MNSPLKRMGENSILENDTKKKKEKNCCTNGKIYLECHPLEHHIQELPNYRFLAMMVETNTRISWPQLMQLLFAMP